VNQVAVLLILAPVVHDVAQVDSTGYVSKVAHAQFAAAFGFQPAKLKRLTAYDTNASEYASKYLTQFAHTNVSHAPRLFATEHAVGFANHARKKFATELALGMRTTHENCLLPNLPLGLRAMHKNNLLQSMPN
jgi:hypothetical protein